MEQVTSAKQRRQELMQSILDCGTQAFQPTSSNACTRRAFDELIQKTKTTNLIPALNILIRPGHAEAWLQKKLMGVLTLAPLRADGVRATLEFVFSVHPSSTVKLSEAAVPQKRGANITQEALALASQLISAPPAAVTADAWFAGIAPQLLRLLDGNEGPELTKTAAYVIGFGMLGRKTSGAPGTPGWRYLAEPMLNCIMPPADVFADEILPDTGEEIIDLGERRAMVSAAHLAQAIQRIRSLLASHPNPGLCKRLLGPIVLPIWALSSWPNSADTGAVAERYRKPAVELLKIYMTLVPSVDVVMYIISNLGYFGGRNRDKPEWTYLETRDGNLRVVSTTLAEQIMAVSQHSLHLLEPKTAALLDVMEQVCSDADMAAIFLRLFKEWRASSSKEKTGDVVFRDEDTGDAVRQVTSIHVLQGMMERFPSKLASQPTHVLEIVDQVLQESQGAAGDDEGFEIALSLLNMALSTPGFRKSKLDRSMLSCIECSLTRLSESAGNDVKGTARNLLWLLRAWDDADDGSQTSSATRERVEDTKTYRLAISYITQPDAPPPVKYEGLHLLSGLIVSRSPVLDVPGTLVLLSSLLADSEDYINLRIIKLYTQLGDRHPRSVTGELLHHYMDAKELASVDTRLRFGEALLRVVQELGQAFSGHVARQVGEGLLFLASRRGHRPKTEARQARDERHRQMKNKEAADAWGGEVPDLGPDDDEVPEEERVRNDMIAALVAGWESKGGAEDIRIRASALSVLAAALEANISGLGGALASAAMDVSMGALQLERGTEAGILRRAAVLVVLGFVRALDGVGKGGFAGFGSATRDHVLGVLRFVADTDGDGLVRQHARDVVESLENWSAGALLSAATGDGDAAARAVLDGGLTRLAGLAMDSGPPAASAGLRPSIEEVD